MTQEKKPERKFGRPTQDVYSLEEFCQTLTYFPLERGQYVLDVADNGEIKFSKLQKRWINKEEFAQV